MTRNLLETNNMELKKIVKDMVAGNTGYGICNFESDEKYIAYAPINSTGWSLGVVIPVSVINKAIGSTKEKIDAASEETSHKINESIKQISENLNKTANRMQNMYLILAVFAVISTSLSALYFGRNIRHYGMKLKETKEDLNNIIENANDIIFTLDLFGNFTILNKKAEEITGYKKKELIGRPFTELLAPEYVDISINRFKKIIQGDLIESSELEIITKYGKRVRLELNATLIKENGKIVGVQGIARDITEKKKLEHRLKEYTEKLEQKVKERTKELADLKEFNESIIENINTNIIVVNKDFIVTKVNKAEEKNYNIKREDLIGKNILDINPNLEKEGFDK